MKGTVHERIIDRLDIIKSKNFSSAKDTVKKMRRQVIHGRKYMQKAYQTKD